MLVNYLLFDSHEQALKLRSLLKDEGIRTRIAPAPRSLTRCCGVSLIVAEDDADSVRDYIESHPGLCRKFEAAEQDFNPNRDRYC